MGGHRRIEVKKIIQFVQLVALIHFFAFASIAWAEHPAEVIVKDAVSIMMTKLTEDKAQIQKDPQHLLGLVEKYVLPHFDFKKMSSWALGKYSRKATDKQKAEFTEQFRLLLVRTYSKALVEGTDRKVIYLPMRKSKKANEVVVRTEIEQGSAFPLPINYKMHTVKDKWKVYDVSIDGISIVSNYRNTFAKEIRKSGIDKLIARLSSKNIASK